LNAQKPLVGNRERYLCSRPFGLELRPFKPGAYGDPAPLAEYLPLLHRAYTGRPTCTLAVYRVDPSAGSSARPVAARADAADGSAKCQWSRNVATHRARHRPRRTASLLTLHLRRSLVQPRRNRRNRAKSTVGRFVHVCT